MGQLSHSSTRRRGRGADVGGRGRCPRHLTTALVLAGPTGKPVQFQPSLFGPAKASMRGCRRSNPNNAKVQVPAAKSIAIPFSRRIR